MVMILFFVDHGMTISCSSSSSSSSRRGMSIVVFGRCSVIVIVWSTRITVSMSSTLIVPVIDRVIHVWIRRVALNSVFLLVMMARRQCRWLIAA